MAYDEHAPPLSAPSSVEKKSDHGLTWTVVSPIVLTYRITQSQNLLDPTNDTLLWGHLEDGHRGSSKSVKRFVVVDDTVNQLYGPCISQYFKSRDVNCKILPLRTTEENKSLELVTKILEELHAFSIDRRCEPIVAMGGGVCLDVVGLVAALYRRRTPYIRVPTTLLAYIDASVGAKNGVNFCGGKNKLGTYIPPAATFLDRSFFKTLPRRQISNGMAEMLKMALMKHRGLFEILEVEGKTLLDTKFQTRGQKDASEEEGGASKSTRIAIETMLEELAPNLWEDDLDRLVDFGHLISPELEMKVLPALLHGEAVNIDMSFMVYLARHRGLLTAEEKDRIVKCMLGMELPVWHRDVSLDLIRKSLKERLKHSGGSLRMPLPTGLGRAGEIFLLKSRLKINKNDFFFLPEIFHEAIADDVLCQTFWRWTDELKINPQTPRLEYNV
ncbi:2-epi-5-epi-valiolone synthase-like [Neosynchiropus ocellatus]